MDDSTYRTHRRFDRVARLLGEAIKRIHSSDSVSSLFV